LAFSQLNATPPFVRHPSTATEHRARHLRLQVIDEAMQPGGVLEFGRARVDLRFGGPGGRSVANGSHIKAFRRVLNGQGFSW
jgi:hypothetical protein